MNGEKNPPQEPASGPPTDLMVPRVVPHEHGDGVEALEALCAEQVRQLVGALLELPVGDDLGGLADGQPDAGHDNRGLVGLQLCVVVAV